jgi:hypothetical protein
VKAFGDIITYGGHPDYILRLQTRAGVAGVVMTYLYFDLRVRHELAAADPAARGELPSELPATP